MAPHLLAAALAALARRVSLDAAGFATAADRAASLPLKRLLEARSDGCRDDLRALGQAVDTLPAGSLAAAQAMLRVANDEPSWPGLRGAAPAYALDAALVEACELAEAETLADYERLLAMALPRAVREPLARAAARSRASHRVLQRLAALEREHAA